VFRIIVGECVVISEECVTRINAMIIHHQGLVVCHDYDGLILDNGAIVMPALRG
jgi:hypothetical protein